jgi:hypothetical protein
MRRHSLSWVGPFGLGALLMYFLDPSRGRRRRARLSARGMSTARRAGQRTADVARDLRNRARGAAARRHRRNDAGYVDDAVVEARVRTAVGRVSTHPGAIAVAVLGGVVELNGPVLAWEHDAVVDAVMTTRGVLDVVNNLTQHEHSFDIPGLQGDGSLPRSSAQRWPKIAVMCAAAGGAGLIAYRVGATRTQFQSKEVA